MPMPARCVVGLGASSMIRALASRDQRAQALLDRRRAPSGRPCSRTSTAVLRGDLAGLRAAHPVGHREQRRARVEGVLVAPALAAGVGALEVLGDAQHHRSA